MPKFRATWILRTLMEICKNRNILAKNIVGRNKGCLIVLDLASKILHKVEIQFEMEQRAF